MDFFLLIVFEITDFSFLPRRWLQNKVLRTLKREIYSGNDGA